MLVTDRVYYYCSSIAAAAVTAAAAASCHSPFLPGISLEPTVIPTVQTSNFRLRYFA
jgi:hypothetical protein